MFSHTCILALTPWLCIFNNETSVLHLLILLLQLDNLIQFSKIIIGLFIKSLFMKIEAGKLLGHEEKW